MWSRHPFKGNMKIRNSLLAARVQIKSMCITELKVVNTNILTNLEELAVGSRSRTQVNRGLSRNTSQRRHHAGKGISSRAPNRPPRPLFRRRRRKNGPVAPPGRRKSPVRTFFPPGGHRPNPARWGAVGGSGAREKHAWPTPTGEKSRFSSPDSPRTPRALGHH